MSYVCFIFLHTSYFRKIPKNDLIEKLKTNYTNIVMLAKCTQRESSHECLLLA